MRSILAAALIFAAPLSAQVKSVYIEQLTWPEIRAAMTAGYTTAIIYTGSLEQNGPHMVLGKHNVVAPAGGGADRARAGSRARVSHPALCAHRQSQPQVGPHAVPGQRNLGT